MGLNEQFCGEYKLQCLHSFHLDRSGLVRCMIDENVEIICEMECKIVN